MRAVRRLLPCRAPFDPRLTFGYPGGWPTARLEADGWWRASNTPAGPSTARVTIDRRVAMVSVEAWGAGAEWIIEHAPALTGSSDDAGSFVSCNPRVAALQRQLPGLRLIGSSCVHDAAMVRIIEQRVTSIEARRSWHMLVNRHGAPAPGPCPLRIPPEPARVLSLRDWEWRTLGIEGRRASALRVAAAAAHRLDEAVELGADVLRVRLSALRGIGPWTVAHLLHSVAADADAVPVGDWHLPRLVGFALADEARADDARLLELLEPFRPHRARVWRLILASGRRPPRHAPRAPILGLLRAEDRRHSSRPHSSTRLNVYR